MVQFDNGKYGTKQNKTKNKKQKTKKNGTVFDNLCSLFLYSVIEGYYWLMNKFFESINPHHVSYSMN
jgi:hypothetical protein